MSCPTNSLTFSSSGGALTNRPDGYSFDACGDILNDGTNTTLSYDGECRLVSSSGGLGSGTYSYDGDGMRVKRVSGSTTTITVYAGSQVIDEYDNGAAPGSPSREYIYAVAQRVAEISGSSTYYFQADQLSARMLTDSSGNVIDQLGHFPYGESWYESGPTTTPWKFTTYTRDSESNNDYAVARMYINRFGRFMSADPDAADAQNPSDPQSWNLYSYVLNNPIGMADPLGLFCVWDNGSYDAPDDPNTGSFAQCQGSDGAGGTWFYGDPSDWGFGSDWSAEGNGAIAEDAEQLNPDGVGEIGPPGTVTVSATPDIFPTQPTGIVPQLDVCGGFVAPLLGNPPITTHFGAVDSSHPLPHTGVDFAVPTGTPVFAPQGGTLTSATSKTAGTYVVITGPLSTTILMHLSRSLSFSPSPVSAGDKVALSGNSGRSTGPHLHYELHSPGALFGPDLKFNRATLLRPCGRS